jgi:membrane-bound metal-dependent hydrolase YbcI (DUF457 family)
MNYTQHILIGVGTAGLAVLAGRAIGLPRPDTMTLLIGTGVIAAGAIAVDIDHPRSFISSGLPLDILDRLLPLVVLVAVLAAALLAGRDAKGLMSLLQTSWVKLTLTIVGWALALMLASWLIAGTLRHRGPLHSLAFSVGMTVVAVGVLLFFVPGSSWWWGLGFGWGWLSHVLADGLTQYGVLLWWPLSSRRVHVLPYPGFGWVGRVAVVLGGLALLGTVWFVWVKG